uniref:IP16830p n=1 Tax=Drosophila melanogaster TaxID=7227 RepID=A1A6P0_DROME|nr:IP16830p [Drosophila melanogaster]ABL75684.1 IP17130p [Drosophila melanogaster]
MALGHGYFGGNLNLGNSRPTHLSSANWRHADCGSLCSATNSSTDAIETVG